jgi:hypothetical protein
MPRGEMILSTEQFFFIPKKNYFLEIEVQVKGWKYH